MSTLPYNNAGRRVNFKFNKDMTEIMSFTVYEGGRDGEPSIPTTYDAKSSTDKDIMKDMAGVAMYNLLFYQAILHSTFHTLHYVMINSWVEAARKFKPMKKWAKWYNKGILSVYFIQAVSLDAVFFGDYGYNATKVGEGPASQKEILNSFSSAPTADAFLSSFFELSRQDMEHGGILSEFFNHFDLIQGFSQDASDALKSIDGKKFRTTQNALVHKLNYDCGEFESNIQNFDEFLQLLSVTSLIHGSTRTLARYFATYSVTRWNSPEEENWTEADAALM
ncbi:MAG: hypothetical protein SGARI_007792, partial [Bacillariaceae sp.]